MAASQPEIYIIICLIMGEDIPFSIEIANNETVHYLKDRIKQKTENTLATIAAYQLTLYYIEIMCDDDLVKNVQKKMSEKQSPLRVTSILANVFKGTPNGNTVHIIVEPPTSGKCSPQAQGRNRSPMMRTNNYKNEGGVVLGVILSLANIGHCLWNQRLVVIDICNHVVNGFPSHRPPEAQYQEEYYRRVHEMTNGSVRISPEYAAAAGSRTGRIDFFIPSKKWGIELTRDGLKLGEHDSRFADDGAYGQWLQSSDMADYVLLDFRGTIPSQPHSDKSVAMRSFG